MFAQVMKLTERQRAALGKLLDSRVVDQVLDADEQQVLDQRRSLIAQRAELHARVAKEAPAAAAKAAASLKRLEQAKLELSAALQAERDAQQALDNTMRRKPIGKLEFELRGGADPRIREFRYYLEALHDAASANFRSWPEQVAWRQMQIATNAKEVEAARAVLRDVIARTHALELEAIGYAELTQWFVETAERIAPVLARLSLNPPQIANDGGLGAPLLWRDRSSWLVDEIEQPRREPAKAD